MTQTENDQNIQVKYSIDFLYEKENITDSQDEIFLDSIEMCELPGLPRNFNGPQYLSAITGYQMQIVENYRITDVLMGTSLRFDIN